MIRLLHESDRPALLALLHGDARRNLYLLGNLEKLGFTQDFCQFWGDLVITPAGEELRAVINRYMTGWVVYGRPDADWAGLATVIDQHPVCATRLQDNPGGITSFLPYLQRYCATNVEEEEMMSLAPAALRPASSLPGITTRRGTMADLPALIPFFADAGDMARTPPAVARPLQDTRLWLAEEAGQIVATALTNAEIAGYAMIGGVYTQPAARNRGVSQALCRALCQELLAEGKEPLLYWRNPAAGAVYRKLGFQPIGVWRAVWLQAL